MIRPDACTVLVVDDEELIRRALARAITRLGFKVHVVGNACDAMRVALKEKLEAVLLDIRLGHFVNGIHLGSQFKGLGVPIIYITAYDDPDIREQAEENDPAAYLLKPFGTPELREALQAAIPGIVFETLQAT